MKKGQLRNSVLLIITAMIWGLAFVAQSKATGLGTFTINGLRNLIGAVILIPLVLVLDKTGHTIRKPVDKRDRKNLWLGGLLSGIALFVAENFQQFGISLGASAGKAGFLTACYILIVPVLGIFLKKKCGFNVWIGVAAALVGLYFLCINGEFRLAATDIWLIACAFAFSIQILLIDYFATVTDPVRLSIVQFLVCGIISCICMFFTDMGHGTEMTSWLASLNSPDSVFALLFLGILSTGVAYTLQVVAQPGLNPTVASMIMSLESAFSLLFGWLILRQSLSLREGIGCILIFTAVIVAQLPVEKLGKKK